MSASVVTVPADTSLVVAAERMREEDTNSLIVDSDPYTIVTSTDIVEAVGDGRAVTELSAADVTTEVVATAAPDQAITEAAAVMFGRRESPRP